MTTVISVIFGTGRFVCWMGLEIEKFSVDNAAIQRPSVPGGSCVVTEPKVTSVLSAVWCVHSLVVLSWLSLPAARTVSTPRSRTAAFYRVCVFCQLHQTSNSDDMSSWNDSHWVKSHRWAPRWRIRTHSMKKNVYVEEHMFWELMGICFSCRRPTSGRLNSKISEHISASVTPLHVCLEEQRGPELGSCDASQAHRPQVSLIHCVYIFI